VAECLPSKYEALSSKFNIAKEEEKRRRRRREERRRRR
jgi:hypothetical protein